jgi:hypothetical protein
MPTDLGAIRPPSGRAYAGDEGPTDPGGRRGGREDDIPTKIPGSKRGYKGRKFLDPDDEEETILGRFYSDKDDVTEPEFAPVGLMGILWVKEGSRPGQIYKIKDGTEIGRKDADVVLDDPKVSSKHARLRVINNQFRITDFDSINGTFVNGERIEAPTLLNENDTVKIGKTIFVLKVLQ